MSNKVKLTELGDAEHKVDSSATIDTAVGGSATKSAAKVKLTEMHMPQSADATSEDRERLRTQMSLSNMTRGYLGDELEDTRQSIEDYNPQMYAQQRRMAAYNYFDKGTGDNDFTPIETRSRIADVYNDAVTDNPRNNYIANKHRVADIMVSSLPMAEEGSTDVMLGNTRYTREEAYDAMVGMVENTMHNQLFGADPRYRSDYFIKNYGTSLRGYLQQLDNTLAELGEALDSEAGREIGALIDAQTHPDAFVGRYLGALAGKESHGAGMIREARDHIRSIASNNFASGFAEAFDWTTMLTAGVNELMSGVVLNNVLDKAFNGERLTAREEVAYKAYQVSEELNQLHEMVGGRSTWNNIGMGVGESTEVAPQFAAAMVTGGAAAGALGVGLRNLPIRAAGKMVVNSFRKGVLNGIKTGVLTTGRLAGTAALNVGKAEAIGMASSIIMPSTWGNFVDKRNGQFKMEDGKLTFTPSTTWKDAVDAWIEGGAEVGSEMIGVRISSLLGGSARAFGRLIGVDKIARKMGIGTASRTLFGYKKPSFVRNLERNVGFAGPIAEPLSEVWGDAVSNLLKGAVTGRDNWENITSKEYWLTTLGACAIYGGALTTATSALPIAKRYAQIGIYGHQRKKHLEQIEDAELYNAVVEALAIEDMDEAAQKLASLDWKRYHRIDMGNAMDAIRADYAQRVAIGTEEETARLNYFAGVASRASALAYRGKDGTTLENYILRIKDKDGIVYPVISGDATSQFYICYDANFNKVSIPTANVVETSQIAVGEEISNEYDTLFSMEGEMRRQSDLIEAYESLRDGKGVGDRIKGLAQQFGVPVRESGDNVTLADGTTRGVVWDYIADKGEYIVATEDGGMVTVPFYDVLSDNESVAEAQTLNYAQRKQTQVEETLDAQDVVTPDGNVVTTPTAARYAVGDIVYTPTGAQVRVREINSDGTYEVDHNLEESVAPADMRLETFNEADLRGDAAEAVEEVRMQEVEASSTEEVITTEGVAPTEEEIKHDEITPVPMNEDGTINYDAIEDPQQYATLYAQEAGGVEAAIEEVRDMRTAIEEEVSKSMEKWKKAKTANEKMQNRRERNALAARMAFYDNVLNILEAQIAPTETVEATTSKDARMSVSEADTVSDTPQTETETETETPVQREAGIVENEYTPRLRASIAETIDALAKTFGLVVEFVDDVYDADTGARANADIRGNVVRIAWRNRTRSISFLIGHEFTHRMQDLSTAAYGSFKEAVIKFLGEDEWNARVDAMVSLYERAGIRRLREELEDEVTADVVGMLVRDKHAFETFLENKEKTFIDKVIEVFERIIAAISSKVAENRAVKDVIASLNDLIAVAAEAQRENVKTEEKTRFSLSVIQGLSEALNEYKGNGDITTFVERVREVNDNIALNSPIIGGKLAYYEEDGNAEEFEESIEEIVAEYGTEYAPYTAGNVRYSIDIAQKEAERDAIIETAKANGTYLKAPNGKKTNLTPEQWVEVRTSRFKAWFGDWELAEIAEYLKSDDVVAVLNGKEFAKDGAPLTEKVSKFYEENYNGKVDRKGLGEVILDKRSVKDSTIHGFGKAKTAAFAAVPNIITDGRIIDEQKNWKGRNYDSVTIAAPIRIGESNYVGIVIVRKGQGTNANRFYLHEVVLQENLQDESFKTDTKADSHRGDIAKVMQKIFISKENASKIVDANGEPKVVWHGGQFGISNFTPNRNMHFGTKKAAMQRILDEQWGYDNWLVQNEDGSYSWKYEDEYDEANNVQSNKAFATEEEAMEDALLYFGNEVVVKPYFLNIRHLDRTDDASSSWEDAIEVVKDINADVDGIVYENWYEDKGSDSYIAFNPNQIKSATDNVGTYNVNNPDIRYSLITPEMDASYLDAVERGDMATAQKMVMEAAKLAMPNTKVVDENGNPKVVYHGTGSEFYTFRKTSDINELGAGYYFSDSYEMAERYATDETLADNRFRTEALAFDIFTDEMGHSEEDYDDIEFEDDYNESYALAVERLFGNGRVMSVFLNLEKPRILSRVSPDFDPVYQYGFNYHNEGVKAKRYNDGVIDEMFAERHNNLTGNQYVAFNSNQIKSADPVTYDDNGNVIPLSQRFNPKREDIRYSLIGEQGASALDVYDEATTRLDNLEVARDMEAMGRDAFAIKYATGWERGADGLWRYEVDDEITSYTISRLKTERDDVLAERAARIAELKERGDSTLLATYNALPEEYFLLEEVLGEDHPIFAAYPTFRNMRVILAPYRYQSYEGYYDNGTNTILIVDKSGNDLREASVLAHEIQHAIQHKEGFERGTNLEKAGSIDEYNRHAGEVEARNVQTRLLYTPEQRRATLATATEDVAREDQIMLRKGLAENGAARQSLYDAPFFNDEDGEVIYFEDDEIELPAIEVRPRTTEGMIKVYMLNRHLAAKEKIRKETRDIIAVTRKLYKERDAERRKTIHLLRTNAAKIDHILGDLDRESISLFDQALIAIAEGMVHIRWDSDGTHKGIAAEIGLKDGEKKYYSSITKNATQSFEGFVHDWWESMNGYERGIDVQELRNALIDALRESPTATRAIEILRNKYDTALREMEDAIAQTEAQRDMLLAEEKARYDGEVSEFENSEDKSSIIRYYEQGQLINEDMTIAHGALRAMERELNSIRSQLDNKFIKRQISLAEMRKGIEAAKAAVMKAIEDTAVLKFNRRDVATLIDKLKDARSLNDVDAIRKRVEGTLQGYMLRQANNDIHRLLQMRLPNGELAETWIGRQITNGIITAADGKRIMADLWRGHNNKGVSVAKFVHGDTADAMVMLRKMVEENSKRDVLERKEVTGEDGKVRTVAAKFGDDKELTLYVEGIRAANESRIANLEQKMREDMELEESKRKMTANEKVEYETRLLYAKYIDVIEAKQHVNNIRKDIDEIRNNDNIEEARKREIINSLYKALPRAKAAYLKTMQDFATEVSSYMAEGRDKLKAFREAKEKHRNDILTLGRNAVGDVKVTDNPPTVWERIKASARNTISDPDYTYMTTLRVIDHKAPNGEGKFYEHFAYEAQHASDNFFNAQYVHYSRLKDAIARFFPEFKGMNPFKAFAEIMNRTDEIAIGTIEYAKAVVNGKIKEQTTLPLNLSNAMYIVAMWDQPRYQIGMAKHGITEDKIREIKNAIPEEYLGFMEWVRDTFLPDTRKEYDEVHRRMFGISMDEEVNYFPARIMGYIQQVDISESEKTPNAKPSVTTGAIVSRREHGLMPHVGMGYFQMLQAHIQNMDKWAAYAELNEELNTLASDNIFKSRLEAMMPGDGRGRSGKGSLYDIFVSRCAIMAQCFNYSPTSIDAIALWFQKNWATANITHRYFTALKQLSGLAVYAVTPKDLTQQLGRFAKNPAKYMREVSEMSPSFRQRWESRVAGSEILNKELNANGFADLNRSKRSAVTRGASSFWKVVHTVAIEWGMTPNAAVDAVVSAIGFMTLYEGSLNDMRKAGKEVTAADKKKAILEAEMRFNETQQSNEGAYLSRLQRKRSFLLAGVTTYLNATFGLHRLRKEGLREIFKKRTPEEIAEIEAEYGEGAIKRGKRKAWKKLMMGILGDAAFIGMTHGLPALFSLLGSGEDDDDTLWWEDILRFLGEVTLQTTFGGYIGGGLITGLYNGYDYDLTPSWTDFIRDLSKIWDMDSDDTLNDIFSWDRISIYSLTQFVAKYGIGVDTKTFANIVKGLEGTVEGMIYGDGTAEAILMFLNAPKSNINAIAGRIRKGETLQEYITRRLRLESIVFFSDYADYFDVEGRYIGDKTNNDFMMSAYTARNLVKDYNTSYQRSVIAREGGVSTLRDILNTDAEYASKAKQIGWTPEARPNKKALESGSYVAPIPHLEYKEYEQLSNIQTYIAEMSDQIERFVGADEVYYTMVMQRNEAKKNLIKYYDEFNE